MAGVNPNPEQCPEDDALGLKLLERASDRVSSSQASFLRDIKIAAVVLL
jgi:hypothetical protein